MFEDCLHHPPLGINGFILYPAPLLVVFDPVYLLLLVPQRRELSALVEQLWRERTLFEVGMLCTETVDMVALGLQQTALEGSQISSTVYVVVLVTACLYLDIVSQV